MTSPMASTRRRRPALVGAGAWILLVALAAPAAGQARDPFDPVIDTSVETTTDTSQTTSPTSPTESASTSETTTTTTATDEGTLPTTGSSVTSWLAIAYVLVAAGAGILLLARTEDERGSGDARPPRGNGSSTP
jgi:LPXTG-motif cell wall-anchored protein